MQSRRVRRILGTVGAVLFVSFIVIVSTFVIIRFAAIIENPLKIREAIVGYGVWKYVAFSIFNIFQIFFAPVPGNVVTLSSGVLFGLARGIMITWISVVIGGTIVMVFSRFLGHKMIFYLLDEKTQYFETEISRRGGPFILFLSIFPNPLGDGLYYLAGITNVPLKLLIPLTAFGRLPGIIITVLLGDKLFTAGIKGWIVGSAGFLIVIILYMIFARKLETIFARIIKGVNVDTPDTKGRL